MRKIILSLAAASAALTAAAPAAAQGGPWSYSQPWVRGGEQRLLADLGRIDQRIAWAEQRRAVSPREAFGLRREANRIRQRIGWASRNGVNAREFERIREDIRRLHDRLRFERADRDWRRW